MDLRSNPFQSADELAKHLDEVRAQAQKLEALSDQTKGYLVLAQEYLRELINVETDLHIARNVEGMTISDDTLSKVKDLISTAENFLTKNAPELGHAAGAAKITAQYRTSAAPKETPQHEEPDFEL